MKKHLILFEISPFEKEILPIDGKFLMEYLDNIWITNELLFAEEVEEMVQGGIYDSL